MMLPVFKPINQAPPEAVFWAFNHQRQECHPVRLGTAVGFEDTRLPQIPDARQVRHITTGAGFWALWFMDFDPPKVPVSNNSG